MPNQIDWQAEAEKRGFENPAAMIKSCLAGKRLVIDGFRELDVDCTYNSFVNAMRRYKIKLEKPDIWRTRAENAGFSTVKEYILSVLRRHDCMENAAAEIGIAVETLRANVSRYGAYHRYPPRPKGFGKSKRRKPGTEKRVVVMEPVQKEYFGRHYSGDGKCPCRNCEREFCSKYAGECAECLAPGEYADAMAGGCRTTGYAGPNPVLSDFGGRRAMS